MLPYHDSSLTLLQSQDVNQIKSFQRKAEVNHEIQLLKSKMRDSQVCLSWMLCLISSELYRYLLQELELQKLVG